MKKFNEEKVIYVPDLCAEMLLKWKQILIVILVCGALWCSFAVYKKATTRVVTSGQVNSAKSALTTELADAVDELYATEKAQKTANNKVINKWTDEQKKYYELKYAYAESKTAEAPPSPVKYLVVGLLAGCVLAFGKIVLQYVFSNTLKTNMDFTSAGIPVFGTVTMGENKKKKPSKAIARMRGTDLSDAEQKAKMIAADIEITADKDQLQSVYFLLTSGTESEKNTAEMVKNNISTCAVRIGKPDENAEELKQLAGSGNVVVFSTMRKSDNQKTAAYLEMCERYHLNVLGAVTIQS